MNRAGQLRMLSQRLVRLAAQRLLRIDTRDAATQAVLSRQRARDNLDMLAAQCAGTVAAPACARAAAGSSSTAATVRHRATAPAVRTITG
jgi:hypothetical protein